ncbi:MAG: DMT family transporter [Neomegalonema sp.]|nr:DMT family transporter [Neomegalonema sp.]
MSDNARGALAMAIAMLCFSVTDAAMRIILETLPLGQAMSVRGVFAIGFALLAVHWSGAMHRLRAVADRKVLLRNGLEGLAAVMFLGALANMPLAKLVSIMQVSPLIATAMAALLLREPVGWRRWMATLVGFFGVLVIIGADASGITAFALMGLAAAFLAAGRDIATRRIERDVPTIIIALGGVIAITLMGAVLGTQEHWVPVTWPMIALLCTSALGVLGGNFFVSQAMRSGDISFVAPFRYMLVLWATLISFTIFSEVPGWNTWLGAGIVIAAGIYTAHRESQRRRALTAAADSRPRTRQH